ncbi:MAG: SCP2 sterol-binding domain-containing protein [Candidatus Thermoplasmatota archaeon]|jgi:putative sterol carrier protein|nr:SCP2 sterol-binding domain-containing protein [Candidatus Thermoplasmatota archaeon]MDA8143262.1 SCP2 sterol-binding domain-containing protein [Thermoplasmatales archaeon]
MAVFPSAEWLEDYVQRINVNKSYEEAALTWEGDFIFEINEIPGGKSEITRFYLDLYHGKCRSSRIIGNDETVNTAFQYIGHYANWKKMIKGEIDPIQGILTGKFTLKGSRLKVMRYTKAAKLLVQTAASVPTEFPE